MMVNKLTGKLTAAVCSAVISVSALGSAGALTAFAADANTYTSLGIDAAAKADFEQKIAAKTDLPVINVTTKNNSEMILSKEVYTNCVVDVFNTDSSFEMSEVSAGIRVRGNSSAFYGDVEQIKRNPVPYRIKFDKKQNMLGLNDGAKCKSWVLLRADWNVCPNDLAFRMGRELFDDTAFCSDSQFVHLYVNDMLQGTYVLCEQSQINENRVDVTEPEEGYTGTDIGYYLELDNYADREEDNIYFSMDYEAATVTDVRGETRQFVPADYSVKNDVYSEDQVKFIDKYLNNVFKIIYNATEKGQYLTFDKNFDLITSDYLTAKETITAVMDIESVVDMYLLYEIVHDYDCGEGSFYMCVDFAKDSKTPKLQFTSPWDFNWAYNDSNQRYWAGAFCTKSFVNRYGDRSNPWFILLAKQDWFHNLCAEKWQAETENVKNAVSTERSIINKYEKDINAKDQYGSNNALNLLDWVDGRLTWMDKTFVKKEHDHSYSSKVTAEPTCTEDGVITYYCECGDSYTEKIPAAGHDYTESVIAPTGTAKGYTLHKCSICGDTYKDNYTDKLLSVKNAQVTFKSNRVVYTGKKYVPKTTVKMNGKTLVKGTDYKLTCSNAVGPGKAALYVKGIGKYTGSQKLTFYVVPKKAVVSSVKSSAKGKITITWNKDTKAEGYLIRYSKDKTFSSGVKKVYITKNTTSKKTLTKLSSGKKYYVRVASYIIADNKRFLGNTSSVKSVTVK